MWLSVSPLKLRNAANLLCTSAFQGDSVCNGAHCKKALLSDPQLFEDQFGELVTELTEGDFTDPALADALSRLREVCWLSFVTPSHFLTGVEPRFNVPAYFPHRFWCTIPLEVKGTEGCLWLARWGNFFHPISSHRSWCSGLCWSDGVLNWLETVLLHQLKCTSLCEKI